MIIYSIFDRMILCNAAPGSAHSPRGGRIVKDLHQSGCHSVDVPRTDQEAVDVVMNDLGNACCVNGNDRQSRSQRLQQHQPLCFDLRCRGEDRSHSIDARDFLLGIHEAGKTTTIPNPQLIREIHQTHPAHAIPNDKQLRVTVLHCRRSRADDDINALVDIQPPKMQDDGFLGVKLQLIALFLYLTRLS